MKYITTPIYYVNAEPHVGHAVTTLAADVLARFWRLKNKENGQEAYFLTGTDEHGAKIAEAANSANQEPLAFANEISAQFAAAWASLNITPNGFIRTTNPEHEAYVKQFLQNLYDSGAIYKGTYKGWYCVGCEEFKTENQIGENNTCPIHITPLTELEEESYQFKLSEYQDQIVNAIESDELKIQPEARKNEVLSFIKSEGLRDVAISRKNVEWGIALPWDESHTVYVWIDALLNYLSAAEGSVFAEDNRPLWPPTVQLIAKDILRFHAVIWPGLLLAAKKELPKELFVHGYFTVNGQKMSKSLGNVLKPADLIDRYGVDGTRYLLLAAIPFGADGDISFERLDALYNSALANNLGNLVNRVQAMLTRYREGVVPNTEIDLAPFQFLLDKCQRLVEARDISGYLEEIQIRLNRDFNAFIEEKKPWVLAKEEKTEELDNVLTRLSEDLFVIAVLLYPFIPQSSDQILALFGTSIDKVNYATLGKNTQVAGKKISPIKPLFPRLEV